LLGNKVQFSLNFKKDVGKSCLLLRYAEKTFSGNYNVTIGVEFQSKLVKIDEKDCVQL
jgi:GTPase SAR1 family protein